MKPKRLVNLLIAFAAVVFSFAAPRLAQSGYAGAATNLIDGVCYYTCYGGGGGSGPASSGRQCLNLCAGACGGPCLALY